MKYRILSDKGIPKIRKISKKKLGFKGKGHEVCIVGLYVERSLKTGRL
jgi:hypothetical protein